MERRDLFIEVKALIDDALDVVNILAVVSAKVLEELDRFFRVISSFGRHEDQITLLVLIGQRWLSSSIRFLRYPI